MICSETSNRTKINIVCATDDKYVPYCGVMLTSLFENNKDCHVDVFIMIGKPLQEQNQEKFAELAKQYNTNISYCVVDKRSLDKYPIKSENINRWSIAIYYRLYAEELLPKTIDKVLYLDCDTIVNSSLKELFDMDWDGIAVGAVPDMCTEWNEFYERLGYDKLKGYFNSGVLLMNLDYWRKHNIGQQCLIWLADNYDIVVNPDQDVLNAVLADKKKTLPVTYNYQIQLRMPYFFYTFSEALKEEILQTRHPIIIHYASELKPWMAYYYSFPFNDVWHKYKKISLWKAMPDALPAKRKAIAFFKRYILWPLGFKLKKPSLVN